MLELSLRGYKVGRSLLVDADDTIREFIHKLI